MPFTVFEVNGQLLEFIRLPFGGHKRCEGVSTRHDSLCTPAQPEGNTKKFEERPESGRSRGSVAEKKLCAVLGVRQCHCSVTLLELNLTAPIRAKT